MENLKNKVVIITGASSGMGKANALYLANQGAKVVLGDIREDRLQTVVQEIEENKGEVVTTVVDVTKREDVQKLVDKAVEYFHRIDVIINCAGVMPQSYLYENNYEEWTRELTRI